MYRTYWYGAIYSCMYRYSGTKFSTEFIIVLVEVLPVVDVKMLVKMKRARMPCCSRYLNLARYQSLINPFKYRYSYRYFQALSSIFKYQYSVQLYRYFYFRYPATGSYFQVP